MRSIVPTLAMYRLTADQADNSAHLHYDELYLQPETGAIDANRPPPGFVSHQVANLFLNMACNSRILPRKEVRVS